MASSFSTASVGGAKTATNATTSAADEVLFSTPSGALGGSNVVQYAKVFLANTHGADAATSVGAWIANSLDTPAASAAIKLVSSSASDSTSYSVRIRGYNASGVLINELRAMNGTTEVTSVLDYSVTSSRNVTLEFLDSAGDRAANVGDVTVTHDVTVIGIIPAGCGFACTGLAIGVEATVDDTATITDASTAPSGVTFSQPNADADKILVDGGSGDLLAGEAQGYWVRWTLTPGQAAVSDVIVALQCSGA